MNIITACSTKNTVDEVVKEINEQMVLFDAKLLLYFASSKYAPDYISRKMQEAFPDSAVFGCSTAGEIISGKMLDEYADETLDGTEDDTVHHNGTLLFAVRVDVDGMSSERLDDREPCLLPAFNAAFEDIGHVMSGRIVGRAFTGAAVKDDRPRDSRSVSVLKGKFHVPAMCSWACSSLSRMSMRVAPCAMRRLASAGDWLCAISLRISAARFDTCPSTRLMGSPSSFPACVR